MRGARVLLLGVGSLGACTAVGDVTSNGLPSWVRPVPGTGSTTIAGRILGREIRDERTGIVFVLVPPGTFTMGTENNAPVAEQPAHEVRIVHRLGPGGRDHLLRLLERLVNFGGPPP